MARANECWFAWRITDNVRGELHMFTGMSHGTMASLGGISMALASVALLVASTVSHGQAPPGAGGATPCPGWFCSPSSRKCSQGGCESAPPGTTPTPRPNIPGAHGGSCQSCGDSTASYCVRGSGGPCNAGAAGSSACAATGASGTCNGTTGSCVTPQQTTPTACLLASCTPNTSGGGN